MKSRASLVSLAVFAFCFLHSAANAVDWPQWRGVNRDGVSTEKISPASWGKDGPKQLWKKGVGTGVSSVAVRGGRLYTMGNNGGMDVVYCLDAATGAEIWKHTYPQPLDPRQFEGGPGGTPTVDGDRVYTLSHEGDLFCLSADKRQGRLEQKLAERLWRQAPALGLRWLPTDRWQSGHSRLGRRGRIDRRAG